MLAESLMDFHTWLGGPHLSVEGHRGTQVAPLVAAIRSILPECSTHSWSELAAGEYRGGVKAGM